MLLQVRRTIEDNDLVRNGGRVLVAVSGGADSVALLHAMVSISRSMCLQISVAHLNHRIRGKAADEDARFVRKLARELELPCIIGRSDIPRIAGEKGVSLEMAAREERYRFLGDAARRAGADVVATAHTADDQAETILLRLVRGAGGTGLGGIRYRVDINDLAVIRPMLDLRKIDAISFLKGIGAAWREDASNCNVEFQRNMVRHEIMPILEARLNPGVRKALLQAGRLLRDEDEWLEMLTSRILQECTPVRLGGLLLVRALSRHSVGSRRRVLRHWMVANGVPPDLLDFDAVARVDGSLRAERGSMTICLPCGWIVVKGDGALAVRRAQKRSPMNFRSPIQVPGVTVLAEQGLKVCVSISTGIVRVRPKLPGQMPAQASLSLQMLKRRKLYVRSSRIGDRISPFGLTGSKKLQDVFVDGKVPREVRNAIPLLECGREIIWVPGYRIARGWEVKSESYPALQVLVERL